MASGRDGGARETPFSLARQLTVDSLAAAGRRHPIHGLIEVDVTSARRRMREWTEATGERYSLTALVVWCVARAVSQHPAVAAFRAGRRRLVTFDDVDVCVLVEREYEGQAMGAPHVVRRANERSCREIHDEVREAQARPVEVEHGGHSRYALAPSFLRRLWLRWMARSPRRWQSMAGTVCVTSVGMFGAGAGWGLPISQYPLTVTVGGIAAHPALVGGRLVERECLCLTLTLDHDVVDGAAAARFAATLRRELEGASAHIPVPAGPVALPAERP